MLLGRTTPRARSSSSSRRQGRRPSEPAPYLRESLMQYCGAAPVTKFVPYSESLLSRCGNDSYPLLRAVPAMAHPLALRAGDRRRHPDARLAAILGQPHVAGRQRGRRLPRRHRCVPEPRARPGGAHQLSFGRRASTGPPPSLTAAGSTWKSCCPFPFQITNCNLYLRANPARITTEPYTGGWLFEGVPDAGTRTACARDRARVGWSEEKRRMNEFLQHAQSRPADCGRWRPVRRRACARTIDREQMLALFHEFFSPLREQEEKP